MANVWMIRAGEGGYLIDDFAKGFVGIGWNAFGDLSAINSLDAIRSIYIKEYPDETPGRIANAVAVIYKFRSVINMNDKVITYDPNKREYLVGTIAGNYMFGENYIRDYHHIREVRWEGHVSRDSLSASSRNSLGSTLTLFSVNEDVWGEISSLLSGGAAVAGTQNERLEEEKVDLEQIREDTAARAHELIKDKILSLSDDDMERLCAAILRAMGYRTRVSAKGPDRGVDIIASPDGLGLEDPKIKVEVKHRAKTTMGSQEIRSFLGGLREGDKALYVSTGGFTKEAKYEADRSNIPVTLLDLDELAKLTVTYYEAFDLEGRALIPLIKVFWPAE